ncbi:MAG: hypothetical protein D6715_11230 [Calditrichaeota bacterium]|nr:MAG: hypothetical protein D6715_11230 [Calditrichota bacterium]
MRRRMILHLVVFALAMWGQPGLAQEQQAYATGISSPKEALGVEPGERPLRYDEVVSYFRLLDRQSERAVLVENGHTFEGRTLVYLLVSSAENLKRREEIRRQLAALADPGATGQAEAEPIIRHSPAVAWMMYSIHGDELSGTDAAVWLAYRLVAGEDSLARALRRQLVVGIDPMENPDGRERFLAMMQQWQSSRPNPDVQSIQHTGVWPWGRGNHFLFDLNRDWFPLVNPESWARVKAVAYWHPQLVVDAHEMGSLDTYLFPPAREPLNPNITGALKNWVHKFSQAQARAFDQHGWSYYTREWLEDWYPGYGSNWPYYRGAIPILYEQAGTEGTVVLRPDGTRLTYRQAVEHQLVSSLSNLSTLAANRQAILRAYYRHYREAVRGVGSGKPAAYYLVPGENPSRLGELVKRLLHQGIRCYLAEAPVTVPDLHDVWHDGPVRKTLPAGTVIIPTNQPLRFLIQAILEFDPRMSTHFLKWERETLLKQHRTRLYEVSAWSLPLAYGVAAYWSGRPVRANMMLLQTWEEAEGQLYNQDAGYGYVLSWRDDRAEQALVRMFEAGIQVRATVEDFSVSGRSFSGGALLIRRNENKDPLASRLAEIARSTGVEILGVNTARTSAGPDLGGNRFRLLVAPRVAVLAGSAFSTTSFSALWYLLDQQLKLPYSIVHQDRLAQTDLRPYNVLILPAAWSPQSLTDVLDKSVLKKIKTWVQQGGTLIASGNSAAFLADTARHFSRVRLRRQVLDRLQEYAWARRLFEGALNRPVDSLAVWEASPAVTTPPANKEKPLGKSQLVQWDEHLRLFQPRGPILRADLNSEHWLALGMGKRIPVLLYTSFAYLAKEPVQVVARLSEGKTLRLSGLLWPEARTRWQNTAYATREALGSGQVILFADEPFFRAFFHGSGRLLINAILLGPGMGTSPPMPGLGAGSSAN